MSGVLLSVVEIFSGLFIFLLKVLAVVFIPFLVSCLCWYVYYRYVKKMKMKLGARIKKPMGENIFIKIFILFPQRLILDMFNREPYEFREYGLHLFCGEQGSGKTITMCYFLNQLIRKYPKLRVRTNFCYIKEVDNISDWKAILHADNGIYGQVEALDELQNWFSSMESKNFPPEMLTEITQQRKQRKIIMGTSQVFTRVAKPIREQVTYLYEPHTLFGAFTVCMVFKPQCDENGSVMKKRFLKMFCFPHTPELRESYDTYKKIEKYSETGFQERPVIVERNIVTK